LRHISNHRHKIIVVAELSEKVLKHGAGRACPNGLVSPSQLIFELRKLLDVCDECASDMPAAG
jgi:hypothetical protein